MAYRHLALELVRTIRHDGKGGVTDDLDTTGRFTAWLDTQAELLGGEVDPASFAGDQEARRRVVALRRAVRSLFARAVAPDPPSKADADRLLDPDVALTELNAAAAAVPRAPQLDWPSQEEPRPRYRLAPTDSTTRLLAALARAAIDFLSGDERTRLRACPAPRCVRYFVKEHPRQEWCRPSCGNRARVTRHYHRHHPE